MGLEAATGVKRWGDENPEPGDSDGEPVHPHALSQAFKRVARRAGVPVIRLHDLRHSHGSLLIKEGLR
jgi:integrase